MLLNVSKILSYGLGFILLILSLVILSKGYGLLALLVSVSGTLMFGGGLLMNKASENHNRWAASLDKDHTVVSLDVDNV